MNDAVSAVALTWLVDVIETEFVALRLGPPALHAAFSAALTHAVGPDVPALMIEAGNRIADAMDAAAQAGPELAYHDRHHVAEAVLSMGWLVGEARRQGMVRTDAATLALVGMVGHDLLHDGSPPRGGVLEQRAADAVARATSGLGISEHGRAVIRAVIMGTDPFRVGSNAARAAGLLPAGPLGREVDTLIAMANEADVLASLMPDLGWELTEALARERALANDPDAADLLTFNARLRFLQTYDRQSRAARALGLEAIVNRQIQSFAPFGDTLEEGAAALDRLPRAEARDRYRAALA